MYNKILVPLDGSHLAEAVLPYVTFLATVLQAPVDLLNVDDPETALRIKGSDYLQKVAALLPRAVPVSCRWAQGRAAEMILDTASTDGGALIAMATHGQTGGRGWLLGQVARKVLQASANPLLIVRPDEKTSLAGPVRLATIIVPLDGSHLAEQIFPHVVYLATKLKLAMVLIRSYTLPTSGYFMAAGLAPSDVKNLGDRIKEDLANYLRAKVKELMTQGVEDVSFTVVEGNGAEEIIGLAKRTSDNLIAMSSHGRSGISRWVMGSVTDRVVSYSGNPVLIIRPTLSTPQAASQERATR
ncbi:MAG TPA: universal stress protein [Candidatus Binatia bacterium]|jgi:nucleotide-binding universal stress UspA family protein